MYPGEQSQRAGLRVAQWTDPQLVCRLLRQTSVKQPKEQDCQVQHAESWACSAHTTASLAMCRTAHAALACRCNACTRRSHRRSKKAAAFGCKPAPRPSIRIKRELALKSRYVLPGRLQDVGSRFRHPDWAGASDSAGSWTTSLYSRPTQPTLTQHHTQVKKPCQPEANQRQSTLRPPQRLLRAPKARLLRALLGTPASPPLTCSCSPRAPRSSRAP